MAQSIDRAVTMRPDYRRQRVSTERPRASVAGTGVALVALALSLSALPSFRPEVAGFSVHPFLAVLALLVPTTISAIARVPVRVLVAIFAFAAWFFLSMVPEGFALNEAVKLTASVMTMLAAAALVRSERDVVVVVVGMATALLIISSRGLILGVLGQAADPMGGINVMAGIGNKNVFSLYALPTMLLVGWTVTRLNTSRYERYLLSGSLIVMTLATFASANRSGWLGAVMVGLMVLFGKFSTRALVAVGAAFVAVYVMLGNIGNTRTMVQRRLDDTTGGENISDAARVEMVTASLELGLENPFLGVSPQRVGSRLARRLDVRYNSIDPHNAYAYVVASSGFPALVALFVLLASIAFPLTLQRRLGTHLGKMIVALWLFRGLFTHEILFSPTFALGLGLSVAISSMSAAGLERLRHGPLAAPERANHSVMAT